MFSKPAASGSLTVNTTGTSSLFGGNNPQSATSSASAGGLFGGTLGGATTSQPQTGNIFAGLGSSQAPQNTLFGATGSNTNPTTATSQPTSGSIFSGATSNAQPQQQPGAGNFSLFGGANAQSQTTSSGSTLFPTNTATASSNQPKSSLFGGAGQTTGLSTNTGGIFGTNTQQQTQQQQGPTLSLFSNPTGQSNSDQPTNSKVVQGVKIDVSSLAPTTKFDNCSDDLKKEIENIDTFILNQIRMCNEVSDLLPTISAQGAMIPNDVEFVQGKLDTLQESLENDANGIDHARTLAKKDAAEAKLAFRTLDTLLLPLQYQPNHGERWWPAGQQGQSNHPLRSPLGLRNGGTLALPEGVEVDSTATSLNEPGNLVDYFSQRTDDMTAVLDEYRKTLNDIENHLYNVENSLQTKIHSLASSKGRDGRSASDLHSSRVRELAATLGDVETAILGVATRVGSAKEEVQSLVLGPLGMNGGNVWRSRAY